MKQCLFFVCEYPLKSNSPPSFFQLHRQPLMNDTPPPFFLRSPPPPFDSLPYPRPTHISRLGVDRKLVCLPLISPNLSAVISPWPDHPSSAIFPSSTLSVCLCVCWTLTGPRPAVFCSMTRSVVPLRWALKTSSASRLWWLGSPGSKMSVRSCVEEKQSVERSTSLPARFIAGDVSEDNRWQLCSPLKRTSKHDKMVGAVWQFDRLKWAAPHQTWTIADLKFIEVCGKACLPTAIEHQAISE